MILVLLGTQNLSFKRLLDAVQKEIDNGIIKDKVVVQAGSTHYESKDMEIFDLIPIDEMKELIKKSSLIITHGGVGSIMDGIKNNKKIIAAPRLKEYSEHVNNHQLEIINTFSELGYIMPLIEFDALGDLIKKTTKFEPKKFRSNTKNMINLLDNYINGL